jgi:enoyl-CoA hydratase
VGASRRRLSADHAGSDEAVRRIRRTLSREEGEDLILRAYMSENFREGSVWSRRP